MKINQKILVIIASSIVIFYFIHEVLSYIEELDQVKKESYAKNELIFNTINTMQSDNVKGLAMLLANDNEIKKGYLQNDPSIIMNHLNSFWKKAKADNLVYEIHFFKPPAESFVNFSDFKSIGKDVSSARNDIVWVTSSFKDSTHTMMCKSYAGLRATFPIENDGKILGGLSLGKKIDWLPKIFKDVSQLDTFLIYDKASTSTLDKKYLEYFLSDKEVVGEFILADKTIAISSNIIKEIDFTKPIQNITINGKKYFLNIFKINDFNHKGLGYICVLNNLDLFNSRFVEKIMKSIFLLFIVSILIYLLLKHKIETIKERIEYLKDITKEFKMNNFSILDKVVNKQKKLVYDELSELQTDIIDMGKSLQLNYDSLEEQIKERTKELEYERNYLKSVLDLTPEITFVTNGLKLKTANQRFFEFVEAASLEEFLKVHNCICDFFVSVNGGKFSEDKTIAGEIWSVYIAHHSEILHTAILEKNGKLHYTNIKAVFLNNNDVLVTLQDITDLKHKDKLLFEQSKMASMGEMIGNIAHQWRQPLSLIATSATGMLMQKEYGMLSDERFESACDIINRNAQYLSQTIDDFRDFIKGERTKVNFNIKKNIESFMKIVEGTIKSNNLNMILSIEDNIFLNSYPNELNQCLINIFNNAKDVLKDIPEDDRYIFIESYNEEEMVILKIKDSGGGIKDEVLPKIFEPYFTTKHKSQGTGLGLHMTYNIIVDGLGGTVEAINETYKYDNKEYKGACFIIRLPKSL